MEEGEPAPSLEESSAAAIGVDANSLTINTIPLGDGSLLRPLTDRGLGHLLCGARATAGLVKGCYGFEVTGCGLITPPDSEQDGPRVQALLRIGFATAESSVLLCERHSKAAWFESDGAFVVNGSERRKSPAFSLSDCVAVVLDRSSSPAPTMQLYVGGQLQGEAQPLPETSEPGQPLYPTVSFRGIMVKMDLGCPAQLADEDSGSTASDSSLPFRLLAQAKQPDEVRVAAAPQQPSAAPEAIFPVALPGQGVFEWMQDFLKQHPEYAELSGRKIVDLAACSGLLQSDAAADVDALGNHNQDVCLDGLDVGIPELQDGSGPRLLYELAPELRRSYLVMDLKANLIASERREAVAHFNRHARKRVAVVLVRSPKLADGQSNGQAQRPADLRSDELAKSFANFSLPQPDEGFDEVRYLWQDAEGSAAAFSSWMCEMKMMLPVHGLLPGEWFRERWTKWQKLMQEWQKAHREWRKVLDQLLEWQEEESKQEPEYDPGPDVHSVHDVNDIGSGEPLYANFVHEDWLLLNFRAEFHLLGHSFRRDVGDPERTCIHESLVPHYYAVYYSKSLSYASVGSENLEGLAAYIKDTIAVGEDGSVVTKLADDEDFVKLLKLTEQHRRDRMKAVMAGDEEAQLRFPRVQPQALPPASTAAAIPAAAEPSKTETTMTGRKAADPPTARKAANPPTARKAADPPTARKAVNVPTPRRAADRPTPRSVADHPTPRRAADLSTPRRAADLSTPRRAADLSTPRRAADLSTPRRAADLPTTQKVAPLSRPTLGSSSSGRRVFGQSSSETALGGQSTLSSQRSTTGRPSFGSSSSSTRTDRPVPTSIRSERPSPASASSNHRSGVADGRAASTLVYHGKRPSAPIGGPLPPPKRAREDPFSTQLSPR